MAEKINLFELDIDVDSAIKDTQRLTNEVELLKSQTAKAKKEQGASSEEYIRYSTALKGAQGELKTQEKMLLSLEQVNNAQTGSIDEMRKKLAVVKAQWAGLSEEERKNSERGAQLTAQKTELTAALKEEEMATGDATRNVGNYEESLGELVNGYGDAEKAEMGFSEGVKEGEEATGDATKNVNDYDESITGLVPGYGAADKARKGFSTGLNVLSKHPIMIAIGLIVGALIGIFKAMKKNEAFSDKLSEAWAGITAILNVLVEIVIKTGMAIMNMFKSVDGEASAFSKTFTKIKDSIVAIFEDPKEAIADLWKFIKTNFINRLQGLLDFVTNAGKAIYFALGGNFDKAGEAAKEAGKAMVEATTGVEYEKIEKAAKGAADAITKAAAAAKEMAAAAKAESDAIEQLKVGIRKNQTAMTEEIGKYTLALAKARIIEADTTKSTEERLKAVKEAMNIEMRRSELALNHQKMIVDLAEKELAATPELQRQEEQRLAIATERAKLAEIEAKSLDLRREMVTKVATLEKKAAKDKADALASQVEIEIQAMDEELAREEKLIDDKLSATQKAITKADEDKEKAIAKDAEDKKKALAAAEMNYQNEFALLENNEIAKLNKEREYLELKKAQELEFADSIGADTSLIHAKYAKFEKDIEREKTQAKLGLLKEYAGNIATIFGENTKVGKAAAAAETTINAFKAAQGAYASLAAIPIVGVPLGIAAGAAALKSGFDNVKKIYAVKSGLPGEGGGGGAPSSGGGSMGAKPVIPSIGQGLASRQSSGNQTDSIKDGVSQALKAVPMQPTLVTDNVTAAQKNDNRRSETSTV